MVIFTRRPDSFDWFILGPVHVMALSRQSGRAAGTRDAAFDLGNQESEVGAKEGVGGAAGGGLRAADRESGVQGPVAGAG